MKKLRLASLLPLSMLGGMSAMSNPFRVGVKTKREPKMDLSADELKKLESLSGKEKKKYVKELKEKYNA